MRDHDGGLSGTTVPRPHLVMQLDDLLRSGLDLRRQAMSRAQVVGNLRIRRPRRLRRFSGTRLYFVIILLVVACHGRADPDVVEGSVRCRDDLLSRFLLRLPEGVRVILAPVILLV